MKIAIVVQGRFHAFELARALARRGHAVTVFTNYPGWAAEKFGVPRDAVRSFSFHGALARAFGRLHNVIDKPVSEAWLHKMFGRWAAGALAGEEWDVIHCWSGVSEELLRSRAVHARCRLLMRGSAHIRVQSRLLQEEEVRAGVALDRPSEWMIARELREYDLADRILVLSTFSRESFEAEGIRSERMRMLPLGVNVNTFRPSVVQMNARRDRILSGGALRVLYVGNVSFQKGLLDLAATIERLPSDSNFEFQFVGRVLPEAAAVVQRLRSRASFTGHIPESDLPAAYAAADLFLFPTIHDGFGSVLAQAHAAALPIVTTAHGAGTDIVREGVNGWIVSVRDPSAIVNRLQWCHEHRLELAAMTTAIFDAFSSRDWDDCARDFEAVCVELVASSAEVAHHA